MSQTARCDEELRDSHSAIWRRMFASPREMHNGDGANQYQITVVDESCWPELLGRFTDRTVFHSMPWLSVLQHVYRGELLLLSAEQDHRCAAIWPVVRVRKGPIHIVGSPLPGWSTAYMGPLFADDCAREVTLAAMLQHPALRCSYLTCKVIDRSAPIDLRKFGFDPTIRFQTLCIDLDLPEQTLWMNLRSTRRNEIRKAIKCGVEIHAERDATFLNDFWEMSMETYGKSRERPSYNLAMLQSMWTRLLPAGAITVLSAFYEGKRVACHVLLHDDRTMWYWGGASYLQHRSLHASGLLQWEAIREGRKRGHQTYDLIGNYGGPGEFKMSFGPKLVWMSTTWERSSNRFIATLKRHYADVLRSRQRL